MAAVLALSGPAFADVVLDGPRAGESHVDAGGAADAPFFVPFHVERGGSLYAKLLVTDRNAVNDGEPNGSVAPDHAAGVDGWWVHFALLRPQAGTLTGDADPAPSRDDFGFFVDSTPTRLAPVSTGVNYTMVVTVHVPADAAVAGARYDVPVAIAFRDAAVGPSGSSGASLDASRAFTAIIQVAGLSPAPPPAPDGAATPPVEPAPPPGPETQPGLDLGRTGAWLVAAYAAGALLLAVLLALILRDVSVIRRAVVDRTRRPEQIQPPNTGDAEAPLEPDDEARPPPDGSAGR